MLNTNTTKILTQLGSELIYEIIFTIWSTSEILCYTNVKPMYISSNHRIGFSSKLDSPLWAIQLFNVKQIRRHWNSVWGAHMEKYIHRKIYMYRLKPHSFQIWNINNVILYKFAYIQIQTMNTAYSHISIYKYQVISFDVRYDWSTFLSYAGIPALQYRIAYTV